MIFLIMLFINFGLISLAFLYIILDVLAAIAKGTEAPIESLLTKKGKNVALFAMLSFMTLIFLSLTPAI